MAQAPGMIYPQRWQNAFQVVGWPTAVFKSSWLHVGFWGLAGVLLAVVGVGLLMLVPQVDDGEDLLYLAAGGLCAIGFGLWLALKQWRNRHRLFLICPAGLVLAGKGEAEACLWEHVKEILASGGNYEIVRRKGDSWSFSTDSIIHGEQFLTLIRTQADERKIPWKIQKEESE